jgi:carbonic anhydrase
VRRRVRSADMTINSDELVRRNAAFAATGTFAGIPFPTSDTLQVLGCVDSRVDPSDVLGLEIPADELDSKAVADPYAAVRIDAAIARQTLPPSRLVSGLVYDVSTGLIEIVDPATQE